jgi:hypothetical protein
MNSNPLLPGGAVRADAAPAQRQATNPITATAIGLCLAVKAAAAAYLISRHDEHGDQESAAALAGFIALMSFTFGVAFTRRTAAASTEDIETANNLEREALINTALISTGISAVLFATMKLAVENSPTTAIMKNMSPIIALATIFMQLQSILRKQGNPNTAAFDGVVDLTVSLALSHYLDPNPSNYAVANIAGSATGLLLAACQVWYNSNNSDINPLRGMNQHDFRNMNSWASFKSGAAALPGWFDPLVMLASCYYIGDNSTVESMVAPVMLMLFMRGLNSIASTLTMHPIKQEFIDMAAMPARISRHNHMQAAKQSMFIALAAQTTFNLVALALMYTYYTNDICNLVLTDESRNTEQAAIAMQLATIPIFLDCLRVQLNGCKRALGMPLHNTGLENFSLAMLLLLPFAGGLAEHWQWNITNAILTMAAVTNGVSASCKVPEVAETYWDLLSRSNTLRQEQARPPPPPVGDGVVVAVQRLGAA